MKHVLITGGSGFLGGYLARLLGERGYSILGIDTKPPLDSSLWHTYACQDISRISLNDFIEGRLLTCCFHLAGSASVPLSITDPIRDFDRLLPGTVRLINYLAEEQKECHSVIFSSAAVYGNPEVLPIDEEANALPVSPYGIHKIAMETLWVHYSRLFRLKSSVLRIFSAYGAGLKRQIFWDVMQKHFRAEDDAPIILSGTGNESRDFIHAEDIARAALAVAESPEEPGTCNFVNVASGQETSIAEAVDLLLSGLHKVEFDGRSRAGDPLRWRADVSKLRGYGFSPKISLDRGLADYRKFALTEREL